MISKELKFKELPLIKINVFTGNVLQGETLTSTHVSSSGGGGILHNGSGYISAPTIHSHTTTKQAIWIKDDDNQKDLKINIPSNVDVMQGHKLKYVEMYYGKDFVGCVYIENLNTNIYWMYDIVIETFANKFTRKFSKPRILVLLILAPALWWLYLILTYIDMEKLLFIFPTNKTESADLVSKIKDMI